MLYTRIVLFLDVNVLPATLQCTDDDLAYLERMANIKLLKELTVSTCNNSCYYLMLVCMYIQYVTVFWKTDRIDTNNEIHFYL